MAAPTEKELELKALKENLQETQDKLAEATMQEADLISKTASGECGSLKLKRFGAGIKQADKLFAVDWYDNTHVITACKMGQIVISNAKVKSNGMRFVLFEGSGSIPRSVAISADKSKLAVGTGKANTITVCNLPDLSSGEESKSEDDVFLDNSGGPNDKNKTKSLQKHTGGVYALKWLTPTHLLSGAGDSQIMLWDVTQGGGITKAPQDTFQGHTQDVASICTWAGEENVWLSGGGDKAVKLWDKRMSDKNGMAATFYGHSEAILEVKKMHGTAEAFGTSGEDGTFRLWDMRSRRQLQKYGEEWHSTGEADCEGFVSSFAFSKSNRFAFCGAGDGNVNVWDLLSNAVVDTLSWHTSDVTSVVLSPDGSAFASISEEKPPSFEKNFAIWS